MEITFRPIVEPDARKVRYGKRCRVERFLKAYDVIRDGVVVGIVCERMETFEQKTPGRTYVNSRWSTPRWFSKLLGEGYHRMSGCNTRKQATEYLMQRLDAKDPDHD